MDIREVESTADTSTKHKRFSRVEAINRVCRVIVDTYQPKSYTYSVGIADNQEALVVDETDLSDAVGVVNVTHHVSATDAYTGSVGSLVRRHNSLFKVTVSRRGADSAVESFFIWLGNESTKARRINI